MPDPDHPEGDRPATAPPPAAPPRSDAAGMSTAMKRADQQAEPIAAVEMALNSTPAKPTFIAHSHSLDAMLAAQEIALREHVAEVDRKIDELNAERDDAMLAFSMVTAARTAKQKAIT